MTPGFPVRFVPVLAAVALGCWPFRPLPAAALSRTYICFFAEGRAELSDRCRMMLDEAARHWSRRLDGTDVEWASRRPIPACAMRIEVRGAAPELASDTARQQLAMQRAVAAAAQLRARGVPDEALAAVAVPGDDLLVQNAPRDPQNRYVWLWMHEEHCPRAPSPSATDPGR